MIEYLFYTLFFVLPLIFFPKTSEVFEFNKIVALYIFTTLIITAWVIKMIQNKKIIFKRSLLDIPLLIFLGSQLVSTIISIDQRTSIFGYYSRFNGGLLSLVCYALLYWCFVTNFTKEKTEKLIRITLISAIIVAIYGVLEHFGGSISCLFVTGKLNDDCWVQDVRTRVFATLGQPNWLAAILTSLVPLSLHCALTANTERKTKITWIIVSIIFFACILFTKSRSGLLGLAAAYLIFWVFNFAKNLKIFLIISLLFVILVGIFGTPVTPSISELISKQKVQQTTDTSEGGTESGAIREIVWKGAIDVFKHYPITGSGVETFGYSYWEFRPVDHNGTSEWDYLYNKAHNEYLNFAANTGVLGLFSYLILICASIYVMRKNPALMAGYISILITNFFGFSVVNISLILFILPAIAISLNSKTKQDKKEITTNKQKILVCGIILVAGFSLFLIGRYWYADYLYNQSQNELAEGSYKPAIADLQIAIDYEPTEAIYHNQLSRVFTDVTIGLVDQNDATTAAKIVPYAVNESDIAFSLSPHNMNIRQSRINMYLKFAELDGSYLNDAINLTKDTIVISPTDPKLELVLGKAYANAGQLPDAINAFKKALILKPDYNDAKKALETVEKLQIKAK